MSWTAKALRATFERYGARGPNERGDYQMNCPFCDERKGDPDTKYKLSANPGIAHPEDPTVKGGWVCWRCDARGWGNLEFLGKPEAKPPEPDPDLSAPQGFVPFRGNGASLALEPYRQYVRRRGVYEFVEAIGGGACLEGRFEGRVVLPHVVGGKWAGFTARAIDRREPKYLHAKGMDRRRTLWGLEWVPNDGEAVWLVEGPFDALPLFPYGVAAFGKGVTPEQIEMLAGLGRPVVVALDGDAWAEGRALAMRIALRRHANVRWAKLPPGKDPGVLGWTVKLYVQEQ